MMLWGAGLWFLFKETRWHKEPEGDMQTFDTPANTGTAGADAAYQPSDTSNPTY